VEGVGKTGHEGRIGLGVEEFGIVILLVAIYLLRHKQIAH
jgi:hypothetical protein